ncbi:hypothetical protein BDY17DRAFT_328108 [Neohortaea acidophila]|uniref:HIG1 domain-containing protein n=1 Tax=Neohortaea acidophila TaxID=245834 RepID=A0A6A6PF07_9PEZI|nr:uncharacterized protein BDY17DRAFT_328108 [Neohortaea acidophila]KAF2478568.1 hypothetical protein BDY17DRAFT_328108 [Neohortaea acidophila]
MKILTEQEQRDNYYATLKGGLVGGLGGLGLGAAGVWAASLRFPAFRQITLPLRVFLITSSGTFGAIVAADAGSRAYERQRNPDNQYQDEQASIRQQADAQKTGKQRTMNWLSDNRYGVVFGSWVASMGTALGLVGRNPYLTGQQKLVQARVYAQGLTLAVVIISLAFETSDSSRGKGRWETVKVLDPNDPTHKHMIEKKIHHESYEGEDQWMDMVASEERKLKEREKAHKQQQKKDGNGHGNGNGNGNGNGKKNGKGKEKEEKSDELHAKPDEKPPKVNAR